MRELSFRETLLIGRSLGVDIASAVLSDEKKDKQQKHPIALPLPNWNILDLWHSTKMQGAITLP